MSLSYSAVNTILYCRNWKQTVYFYQNQLNLPVTLSTDWLIEFELNAASRVSIANEINSKIKSVHGRGITLSLRVENLQHCHEILLSRGINVGPFIEHQLGTLFRFYDPEGHRIEIWSQPFNDSDNQLSP